MDALHRHDPSPWSLSFFLRRQTLKVIADFMPIVKEEINSNFFLSP